jgi:hypothetical protein
MRHLASEVVYRSGHEYRHDPDPDQNGKRAKILTEFTVDVDVFESSCAQINSDQAVFER